MPFGSICHNVAGAGMRRIYRIGLLAALLLAFAHVAEAQRRVPASRPVNAGSSPVQAQFRQVVRTTARHKAQILSPVATVSSGTRVENLLQGDFPVPGLGFDFPHHAAVNRNLEVRALVDPITKQRLALAREIRREAPVVPAFPIIFFTAPVIVVPPVVIVQQPVPERPQVQQIVERVRYEEPTPETAAAPLPPVPVRELDELIFIRRDGTVTFAVAYSIRGDRIVYITPEGLRRSMLLAEIDLEATEQLNEERGTSLRLRL